MKKTVIFIDGYENLLFLYSEEFREEYDVETCLRGEDALERVGKNPGKYDCAVVSKRLQGNIDGLEILARLKEKGIPVILNSSDISNNDFRTWAAEAIVDKSSDLEPLRKAIKQAS
jgi:CheY-like chemotaxis protein